MLQSGYAANPMQNGCVVSAQPQADAWKRVAVSTKPRHCVLARTHDGRSAAAAQNILSCDAGKGGLLRAAISLTKTGDGMRAGPPERAA